MKWFLIISSCVLLASCTPEPQPTENEFKQEVVDHNDIDYNWE